MRLFLRFKAIESITRQLKLYGRTLKQCFVEFHNLLMGGHICAGNICVKREIIIYTQKSLPNYCLIILASEAEFPN